MPPDIRTGLSALAGTAPTVGTAGQGPPGSDPLAALFASLLAQSGGIQSQIVSALPKPRASARADAPFQDESAPAKQTTPKTDTETTDKNTQTSAPLPILPPPLLPIQMRPIIPPTAGVTVGQKTMDTLPALAALPPETTSAKPDGELPLQGAGRNASDASAKFPPFLIAPSSLKETPLALALPVTPGPALPGILGSASAAPSAMALPAMSVAAASPRLNGEPNVPLSPSVPLPGLTKDQPAPAQPMTASLAASAQVAAVLPRAFILSADVSADMSADVTVQNVTVPQASVPKDKMLQNSTVSPSIILPAPAASLAYTPSSRGISVPIETVLGESQVSGLGEALRGTRLALTAAVSGSTPLDQPAVDGTAQALPNVASSVSPVLPPSLPVIAGLVAAADEAPQKISIGATPGPIEARQTPAPARSISPSVQKTLSGPDAPKTIVNTVGIATEGNAARDGKPATEGVTATEGARDGIAATDGRVARDGKSAMDGTTTEGAQATEGILSTAGAAPVAPGQTHPPSAGAAGPALPTETPEKSLKSAASSADNNTRIAPGGAQTAPAKILPPELTLQVVGKRSERNAAPDTDNNVAAIPATSVLTTGESAKTDVKPLTPADRAEIIKQVADGVGAMRLPARPGDSEQMTLQLHPRDWGQLQVSVKITPGPQSPGVQTNAAQTVTAHIVAQTPQVKAALESNSGDLRSALRASGLHLDKITVTVQSAGASAQAGTASGGSHHETSSGAFSQTSSDQKTDTAGSPSPGMPSFSAFTGSHGGRQGNQTPTAYASPYQTAEPDGEDGFAAEAPRRLMLGQVDTRA
ncbi:MAG: flagellar hook-length control protein FliK [Armatimonadota bacterium]|nr:flagellar hook-length control protein FliK [Armatimonadota bacterium]